MSSVNSETEATGTELVIHESAGPASAEMSGSTLAIVHRTELEVKMAAALSRPPRNETECMLNAKRLVTMDLEIADACTYSLPARKDTDDPITGPSVRFAEIMAYVWGHIEVHSRVLANDGRLAYAEASCTDLQRNYTECRPASRPIVRRDGRPYSMDMIKTTNAALVSIAKRDAILAVIPRALWNVVWKAAISASIGGEDKIAAERERYLEKIAARGVSRERVFSTLGVASAEEMTYEHIAWLKNIGHRVNEGGITLEQAFPEPEKAPVSGASRTDDLASQIASRLAAASEATAGVKTTPEAAPAAAKNENAPQQPEVTAASESKPGVEGKATVPTKKGGTNGGK
jgi:hypothetical protein